MVAPTFAALCAAAHEEGHSGAIAVLTDAETNANETIYLEKEAQPEEFNDLALRSIAFTSAFEEPGVADWFRDHGYTW